MQRLLLLFLLLAFHFNSFGQVSGLINDGATIYMTGGATIFIDGSGGNYINQSGGQITAGSSDSIELKGNWVNDASTPVFTNNGGIVALNGGDQTIGGTNSTSFNTLVLNGTGTKSLTSDVLVGGGYSSPSGLLNLNSHTLDLNGHTLTISNPVAGDSTGGAIRYASGYIISEKDSSANKSIVKWQMGGSGNMGNHVFPFGTASGSHVPVTFNITSTDSSYVSISTRQTIDDSCGANAPGSCNKPWASGVTNMNDLSGQDISVSSIIDRWWQIDVSSPVTANLTLTYQGSENTTNNPTSGFYAQEWNGTTWYGPLGSGTGTTSGVGSVYIPSVNAFGPVVLVESDEELPISLILFKSSCLTRGTVLSWTTATEANTNYFTIERSLDGENFSVIGKVHAAGYSSSSRNYNYVDSSSYSSVAYYRLLETDMNGNKKYFQIISADCHSMSPLALDVYPNPNPGNYLNVNLSGLQNNADVQIRVVNILGQDIMPITNETADDNGMVLTELNFNHNIAKGIYNIMIQSGSRFITKSLVIQ